MGYAGKSNHLVTAYPLEEQTAPVPVEASHHSARHPEPEGGMKLPNVPDPNVHRSVELRGKQEGQKHPMR